MICLGNTEVAAMLTYTLIAIAAGLVLATLAAFKRRHSERLQDAQTRQRLERWAAHGGPNRHRLTISPHGRA